MSLDAEGADKKVKICTLCGEAWEKAFDTTNNKTEIYYYGKDFPTIYKERKNCPTCATNKAKDNVLNQGL